MATSPISGLADALTAAGVRASSRPDAVRRASRDHSWLSPILAGRLPPQMAALVAWPRDAEQLAATIGAAHARGVPVTARGRGTGNYGQSVPLCGGLVVDCSAMDRIVEVGDGWANVAPGVTFSVLERSARAGGQQLAMFPSTVNSTVGGFLGGGAGGSGSIAHGFTWEGNVGALDLLGCGDDPNLETLDAGGAAPHIHAYGTTGIIAGATVRLEPARRWTGVVASFADHRSGARAGMALLAACTPRLLGVTDASLVGSFPSRPWLPVDRASLRAVVATGELDLVREVLAAHGARVEATGHRLVAEVTALSYNHVTLRAKRADEGICHLQVGGPALVERADEVRAALPGARVHLDAMRTHAPTAATAGGGPGGAGFGGLVIAPFLGESALRDGMDGLRALGVVVIDPHTWAVHDPDGARAAAAGRYDPDGLLNPGKLDRSLSRAGR